MKRQLGRGAEPCPRLAVMLKQPMTASWKLTRHLLHNMLTCISQSNLEEAGKVDLLFRFPRTRVR